MKRGTAGLYHQSSDFDSDGEVSGTQAALKWLGMTDKQVKLNNGLEVDRGNAPCDHCPGRTPLRPDPASIQRAQELCFEPPLDEGIREIVIRLVSNGVETFESCEGGPDHAFPEPTVRFEGESSEGLRALSVALENGLPVFRLRRAWGVIDGSIHGPWWEMTFRLLPPKTNGIKD